jgi:CubicO group peptidase (beta-lactamase class C family)
MAVPHDENGAPKTRGPGKPTDSARYAAAGGLLTTPTDYAKFLIEVLDPKPADPFHLTSKSVADMLRPQINVTSTKDYDVLWSLGWRVVRTKKGIIFNHGGDNPGFHCLAEFSPARKTGYVIMTNGDSGPQFLEKFAPGLSETLHPI